MEQEIKTWETEAKNWSEGKTIFSAELGGLGPGYEQVIQILLWEILVRWNDPVSKLTKGKKYSEYYSDFVNRVIKDVDYGYSVSQINAAKSTAYKFMVYGYKEMMDTISDDRHIQVSKNFPSLVNVN